MSVCPMTMQECPGPENCHPATGLLRPDLPKDAAICPIVCVCDCLATMASLSDIVLSRSGVDKEQPASIVAPGVGASEEERIAFLEQVVKPDQEVG